MTLFPVIKRKGWVEDFEWGPGANINVGDDGDVAVVNAGSVDLVTADNMIATYMALMEEMAGAPREAMGFRTPGEKTAYEVQRMENASNRIFDDKIGYFEQLFIEKLVNLVALVARQYSTGETMVPSVDPTYGAVEFLKVTKQDLMSRGKFRAMGARHFQENSVLLQNMNNFANSGLGQDQAIRMHVSNKKMAHLIESWLGVRRFGLVSEYSGIAEQAEAQQMMQQLAPQPPAAPEGAMPPEGEVPVQ
jgi:hypothetical protein